MRTAGCSSCGIGYGLAPRDTPFDEIGPPRPAGQRIRCMGDLCLVERVPPRSIPAARAAGSVLDRSEPECGPLGCPVGPAGRSAGQREVDIDRATWNAMDLHQRMAWIRLNRADVAAEVTARATTEAARETARATAAETAAARAAARTAAETALWSNLINRGFDGIFGASGILRLSHDRRMEELRQSAQTARTRIEADRDVEIARWRAMQAQYTGGGEGTAAEDCEDRCYDRYPRKRTKRRRCIRRCRAGGGWIAAGLAALAVL